MARTKIEYDATAAVNGSFADPAGESVGVGDGNGVYIDGLVAFPELTLLRVSNAGGAATTVHVKAGVQPLATAGGQGDLDVAVGAGVSVFVGPFESARFEQPDGSLAVDADAAVTLTAIRFNRH